MNQIDRCMSEILKKREEDVVKSAGHRREPGEEGRVMAADQIDSDTTV